MTLNGKLTERFWMPKQIGVDEVLAHEIRATASADRRELRDQIRFLIELGLHLRRMQVQEHLAQPAHMPAHLRTSESSSNARTRTVAHVESQQLPLAGCVGPVAAKKRRAS